MPDTTSLSNVDAEYALVGTFLIRPGTLSNYGAYISPDWFTDTGARHFFVAARLAAAAGELSWQSVLANLPDSANADDPQTLKRMYASLLKETVSEPQIPGILAAVRDRWARRTIKLTCEDALRRVPDFNVVPFELATQLSAGMDLIQGAQRERQAGSIEDGIRLLMTGLDAPATLKGFPTGLRALDEKLNGYARKQLYVIAGRPGMGKSAFMVSSLRRTAAAGYGVIIFSLEMSQEEIAARLVSDALDSKQAPFFGAILKGQVNQTQRKDISTVLHSSSGLPLHIDASPRLSFAQISLEARRFKAKCLERGIQLAVICIDHMGLVVPSDRYAGNKVAEAGEVSARARELAKELDCCVVLLCQLSREVEKRDDRRPIMSDLRWSGEIEQDAHVIGLLHREGYYLERQKNADPRVVANARHRLDLLISKNRNGATGDLPFWCSMGHSSIRDMPE